MKNGNGKPVAHHLKKVLVMLLKVALSATIIGYLAYAATKRGDVFTNLRDEPKHWDLLAAAWACCTMAVALTFVRWWYLVRALDVPWPLADAIRMGFWGFLFNLLPLGIVGGDLVKAVMFGHEQPQHRAKGVASVLVDRVIGLYLLFVVASVAMLLTGFWWRIDNPDIHLMCEVTFILTIVGTIGLGVLLGPDLFVSRAIRASGRIPRIGPPLQSLLNAVRLYKHKPLVLFLSSLMSIGVHCSFAVGLYLIACGLPGNHLTLADHFVVIPVSNVAGVLPLPAGPFEAVLDSLYTLVPVAGVPIIAGQGLVVALIYRLITLLIAAFGIPYYLGNRREMAEVIHEVEDEDVAK
jgi:uncharacterized protein (TIRG00374 family)